LFRYFEQTRPARKLTGLAGLSCSRYARSRQPDEHDGRPFYVLSGLSSPSNFSAQPLMQ
jgi:hypothetical protein